MTLNRDRLPAIGIALAALAIAALLLPFRMQFPFDDTYITFRYSANLAHGFGIVWNHGGPHTEGYTNFLYVLLLAPFAAMRLDLIVVSQIVNVAAVLVTAVALARVMDGLDERSGQGRSRPLSPPGAGLVAVALFLLDPFTWFNAYSGMETSVFTMWLLLVVATWEQPRLPWIFATLAALTRPEGVIIGGILFAVKLWQSRASDVTHASHETPRSHLVSAGLLFALPLLLYAAWKLWYFGNLLPNSFYVKVAQAHGHSGLRPLIEFYRGLWFFVVLAGIGWVHYLRRRPRAMPPEILAMLLWTILLSSFYLFSQLLMNFYDRFTNSIEVILIVMAASGYMVLMAGRWSRVFRHPVTISVLMALYLVWSYEAHGGLLLRLSTGSTDSYTDRYDRLAGVFHSIPDHEHITFCWSDAGVVPYYSGMKHTDPVGLNTTSIAHAKTWQEVNRIIALARPDIIVLPLESRSATDGNADSCRIIFRSGHGLIGRGYPTLMKEPGLLTYRAVALVQQTVYDLDIFVDTLSPHYRQIADTMAAHYPKPPHCIQ